MSRDSDDHDNPDQNDDPRDSRSRGETEIFPTAPTSTETALPAYIGQYRILKKLGEGGMGVVFEAEQQNPKRSVALKVIRGSCYVGETQVKMFQREAQTLARLKHPGIATIYESGRTDDGHHFFAMELVRGKTLDKYLREQVHEEGFTRAQLRQQMLIFRRICDAVSYAHQKGVIHRDLKPANIIVTGETAAVSDSSSMFAIPEIKILDFGLARMIDSDNTASVLVTDAGRIQGTIPYMSPEQVSGNSDEIDLRTDVYTLGVILFQLLTRRLPFPVIGESLPEAARVICEKNPPPICKDADGALKHCYDAETIVRKAMEKEPARRYQSAAALSEDVERCLENQPIQARPPSSVYLLTKMVSRHKASFTFAASVVVILAAFAITMTIQADRIAWERDRANQEAASASEVADFLVGLFRVSDPSEARGNTITAREVLDRGRQRIERELGDRPFTQSRLNETIGSVYYNLGLFEEAERPLQEALAARESHLDADDPGVAMSYSRLGLLRLKQGRYDEAEAHLERALLIAEKNPDVGDLGLSAHLHHLALLRLEQGDYAETERLEERALAIRRRELGDEHHIVASSLFNLATVKEEQGHYQEAAALSEQALAMVEKSLGVDHPDVLTGMSSLARIYMHQAKYEEAALLYEQALERRETVLGADHPALASSLNILASAYRRLGRYGEAEPLYKRSLVIREQTLGPDHPKLARTLNSMAILYVRTDRYDEAESHWIRALEIREKALGPDNPELCNTLNNLATLYARQKKFSEAEALMRRVLTISENTFGEQHPKVAMSLHNLATLYRDQGQAAAAEPLLVRSLAIKKTVLGLEHPDVALGYRTLAYIQIDLEQYAAADTSILKALEIYEIVLGVDHRDVAETLSQLGFLRYEHGVATGVDTLFARSLAILEKSLGEDHRLAHFGRRNLAAIYEEQHRYEESLALWRQTVAWERTHYESDDPRLVESLGAYAEVLDALDKADEAAGVRETVH